MKHLHPRSLLRCALLLPLSSGVGACKEEPLERGADVTFDDFCDTKHDRATRDNRLGPLVRVTIEGYPTPPKLFSLCSKTCSFDLNETEDGSGRSIRFSVRLGTAKNELAPLPERFDPADFKLRTNTDTTLGFGDRVRVTGERLGSAAENDCQLTRVDLIEVP